MTSTAGTDDHPEVSEISDFSEGILPPERSADLRGHLAGCALCADVRTSLEEIRDLLGTLPGPPRMPADVAGRIDAALAAEALISATSSPRHTAFAETGRDGDAAEVGSRVSRETSTADRRPAGHPAASTGPGRRVPSSGTVRPRARRRGRALLAAACAAAVLGLGGVLVNTLATSSPPPAAEAFSGTDLSVRVHQLLGTPTKPGPNTGQKTPFTTQVAPPTVPACVLKATGRPESPLAHAEGTYQGRSSYLLVLPHPGDAAQVDAYVVASCGGAGQAATGQVLAQHTYSRR